MEDTAHSVSFKVQDLYLQERVFSVPDLNSPPAIQVSIRKDAPVQHRLKPSKGVCESVVKVPHLRALFSLGRTQSVFMNVLLEALIIAVVLIPIYWVAEKVVGSYGKWVTIAAAGAAFHLLFEVTGLNAAYVKQKA